MQNKHEEEICSLLCSVRDTNEARSLLYDLLTPNERKAVSERWQIVKFLLRGKTQREVRDKLKVSIAKVTRGSSVLQYGSGAFKKFLARMEKEGF